MANTIWDGLTEDVKQVGRRVVGDSLVSLGKGTVGLAEAGIGVGNLVSGGRAGRAAQEAGFDAPAIQAGLDRLYSEEQQAANREVSEARGFLGKIDASLQRPSTIAQTVVESLPMMAGGGVIGRALPAGSALLRAGIGEGLLGAGASAESMRQQNDDGLLNGRQTGAAIGSGIGTGLLGVAGGRVAQKLGITDVDTLLASGARGGALPTAARVAGGAVAEGALEEMPQSAQEQAWQNVGMERPVGEGVPEAAATGLLAGGLTGGAVAGVATPTASQPTPQATAASTPQAVQPAAPVVVNPARGVLSRAVAAGAREGAVPGVVVEEPLALGVPPPPDGLLPTDMPPMPPAQAQGLSAQLLNPQVLDQGFEPLGRGYADLAEERAAEEDDKAYAKRVVDRLPDPTPEQLPRELPRYFNLKKADEVVPLAQLLPSKGAEPTASANALKRMAAAAEGLLSRRDPIDVRANADGSYTVLDGNGTLGAALQLGLPGVPVRVREADPGREGWRTPRGYLRPEASEALTQTFERAAQAKPEFDRINTEIAQRLGAKAAIVELKGRTRSEQKARDDYGGDINRLADLVRTTFEVDTLDQVEAVLAEVQSAYTVPEQKLKHYLAPGSQTPYAGGYRDSKLVVQMPNGTKAEVQINLKPMLEAKKKAHALYEDWRVITAEVEKQGGVYTAAQREALRRLEAEQAAIYEPAWNEVLKTSNSSAEISTPLRAMESMENARPSATSNALTNPPPSGVGTSATGMPSTSKNREPGGNAVDMGAAPVVGSPDSTTDADVGAFLGAADGAGWNLKPAPAKGRKETRPSAEFSVIVAPKPGTLVRGADGALAPYDRSSDAGNLPPVAAPVQREPDLRALQSRVSALFKRPAAATALRKAFGIKGLKLQTIRGSYMGVPELSFQISAEGLTADNAPKLAQFLGMAFAQDAVIVSKPDPVGPAEDSIPTIELHSTNDAKIDEAVFEAVAAELRAQGIDYSEARDGRALRVLHFGDEAGLEQLAMTMATAARTHGLAVNHLHTRSDLYEAQDYRRNLGEGGDQAVSGLRPEVFGALVDQFLVPFSRAAAAVGYRLDPQRYAERFGLEAAEREQLTQKLRAAEPRSSVPVLTGEEPLPARNGRVTNVDAATFLQNRAAAFGEIDAGDRSDTAKEVIAETLAQEVEYQLSKPDGKQAIGWYDRQLKAALAEVGKAHPEIASDERAQFVFKALLATTSQNLAVVKNFEVALKAYETYKRGGKLELRGITLPGKAAPIAKQNIAKLQQVIDQRGLDGAAAFMRQTHSVRELKAAGFTDVTGRMNDRVRGWFVFGPKIGSFGNNLDGDFDTLTADLWFSRTWNRVLGNMFRYTAKAEAEHIKGFRRELVNALNTPGTNEIVDALSEAERAQIGQLETDFALAQALYRNFAKGYKDRSALNRAAKAWVEGVTHLRDVPRGDPERRWQNEVLREVQAKLRDRVGEDISIADLQALLWYQEKELFRLLGAANSQSAPLDYLDGAKAAIAAIEGKGLSKEANATLIETAYPLGRQYLLNAVRRIAKGARVAVLAGNEKSVSRLVVDRELSSDERFKLDRLSGIRKVSPGTFPALAPGQPEPGERKVPPRFQVPTAVSNSRKFAALDEDQQGVVDDALAELKRAGYPASWLKNATYFFAHNNDQSFAGRFYLQGELRGAVSVRQDQFLFERLQRGSIKRMLAHELAHAADFDADAEGMRSSVSPRFEIVRKRDGSIDYTGDIAVELAQAHKALTPLTLELNYPMASPGQFSDDVFKAELFAQSVMLYFTQRADLKRHAPKTAAMIEEMIRDAASGPDRTVAAVSQALRSGRVRPLDLRVPGVEGREAGGAVDREQPDRPRADRGLDGPDRTGQGVTDTPAFKRWFGDSKVVDAEGRPLVVYHGTAGIRDDLAKQGSIPAFDEFSPRRRGSVTGSSDARSGFWFTTSKERAMVAAEEATAVAAESRRGPARREHILSMFLRMENPLRLGDVRALEPAEVASIARRAKALGHDGVIFEAGERGGSDYLVFGQAQIKSADSNSGAFDPDNPSFLGIAPPPAQAFNGFTLPSSVLADHLSQQAGQRLDGYRSAAAAGADKLRTYLQDYFLPVRRVQEAIEQRGGTVDEDSDVYGREELYYGRTGEQLQQLEDQYVKPLVKAMHDAKLSQADVELFLYATFAPSRNARIAAINPAMPDGGSGMTNADAAQVLADFAAAGQTRALQAIAAKVRALNEVRIRTLEDGGLIGAEEARLWREEPDYVPLKGFASDIRGDVDETRLPTGGGFSIGGREAHRALGRKSRATDILANAIAQTEQAIIRAEKNRVATALLRLAQANPNPALWEVDKVREVPYLTPGGEVSYRKDNRQQLADNVVAVKVNGEQHFVTLKDARLAAAMKNLGAAKTGAVLRAFSTVNRFLSLTRTMLAPEFVLANFARDLQTASINLSGEQSAAMAARVVKDVPVAMRAMWGQLRGKSQGGEWSRWAKEFADAGGMTNFVAQRTVEEQQAKIAGLLKDANAGVLRSAWNLGKGALELVEQANGAVENATRLAAYTNARRQGMSIQQAARLAKNLTVNFNRKGQAGTVLNALYLFYNASIQGTQRFLRAMRQPKVQALMAATAVIGYTLAAYNRAAGGEDDDGEDRWDKIPEWEKARNLIFFIPGTEGETIKIPLPYTYNLPFLIGGEIEAMVGGKTEPSTAAANVIEAMLTAFNPIGDLDLQGDSATAASKLIAPTAIDPMIDIAVNRNFFGAPINPERSPFDKVPEPDSELAYASVNPGARWLAKALNRATGGDALRPGAIDVSPGSMVYVFDYLTGGTGSFLERTVTATMLWAAGDPVPDSKVPFWRVFKGELSDRRMTDTFYRLRDDVNLKAELATLAPKGGFTDAGDKRDAALGRRMAPRLKVAERQLRLLRERRKEAQLAGDKDRVKMLEAKERAIQLRFNTQYFAALDSIEGAE